jgi:hypothetical protein
VLPNEDSKYKLAKIVGENIISPDGTDAKPYIKDAYDKEIPIHVPTQADANLVIEYGDIQYIITNAVPGKDTYTYTLKKFDTKQLPSGTKELVNDPTSISQRYQYIQSQNTQGDTIQMDFFEIFPIETPSESNTDGQSGRPIMSRANSAVSGLTSAQGGKKRVRRVTRNRRDRRRKMRKSNKRVRF